MPIRHTCVVLAGLAIGSIAATAAMAQSAGSDLDTMLSQSHQVALDSASGSAPLGEALQIAQADTAAAPSLPNGASSITEIFGDWTVNCAVRGTEKACAASQVQGDSQTGQQVFAVELQTREDGGVGGVMILPFGLDVRAPVSFMLDDVAWGSGAVFTTCMPGGCIVPVAFPASELDALRKGTALAVTANSISTSADAPQFTVSLAGFTAATNRVTELSR